MEFDFSYEVIQTHMNLNTPEIGFAFIYFDHQEAQSQKSTHYIASLLRQLEQQKQTLTNSVQNIYKELSPKCRRPDLRTLSNLLSASANSFMSRTYIIIIIIIINSYYPRRRCQCEPRHVCLLPVSVYSSLLASAASNCSSTQYCYIILRFHSICCSDVFQRVFYQFYIS